MIDRFTDFIKEIFKSRVIPVYIIFFSLFVILIVRMFNLQIVKSDELTSGNVITDEKQRDIQSTRGNIYDRNGKILASNQISYSVTIEDTGTISTNEEKNEMIYKMLQIIYKNGDDLDIDFCIDVNKDGELYYTVNESAQLRFKRDAYFAKSIDELTDEQKAADAQTVFEYLRSDISSNGPRFDVDEKYSVKDALDIIKVRYTMMINSNTKYIPITIASNVKDTTVVAIKENSDELPGVNIDDKTTRLYYDSKYFSNIIGYTGSISNDDLAEIKETYPDYNYTTEDQIGKTGIELSMEETLRGVKGSETLVIDSYSRISGIKDVINPTAGNDVYLTIDSDLQKACYDILEKKLAGILISKINNSNDAGTKGESASDIRIPIYDVYNAVIKNNIVDTDKFASKKASTVEKNVYRKYTSRKKSVLRRLKGCIDTGYTKGTEDLNKEYGSYLAFIYDMLVSDNMLQKDKIDTGDETYKKYSEGKMSLSKFLEYAIVNNWVDLDALDIGEDMYTTSELFEKLKSYIFDELKDNTSFDKLIYQYMIYDYTISGTEICMLLINQGIVSADDSTISSILNGSVSPYSFIRSKIVELELTPAMLALEPCSGSIVITDINNGDVLAYVSYPSYDNNRFANGIDSKYYSKILEDSSYPLINRPSTQKTAPGSTFKMVTATAALEENGILKTPLEKIMDKHEFKEVIPSPKCWSTSSHGNINVTDALKYSCNYFFYEIGYRLGLSPNGSLNHDLGLKKLRKYADMYGLSDTSGVELAEASPKISDYDCVRSAIGQGKNSYTPVQLSRYVTTIANSGKCYDLTIIDKTVSPTDKAVTENKAKIHNRLNISQSTWNYIHQGMRKVVTGGSVDSLFKNLKVDVAGKTGTAQESAYKPNHALFVSYAPYDNPEISVTTVIPNGYTSGNAAELARDIYTYYYDKDKREKLLGSKVSVPENQSNAFSD